MYKKYLDVRSDIKEAIEADKPVVALESTILSHGMPYPENLEFARNVEKIIKEEGAVPATIAIIGGKIKVGLSDEELEIMCKAENVGKVSRRDLPIYISTGKTGATTVTTTMIGAAMAGIKFFATGGLGGVHREAQQTFDISADLQELAHTSVAVICAGAKAILDLNLTMEYLETFGVPVLGLRTDYLPAFYSKSSGLKLDYNCKDEKEVAAIVKAKWEMGLDGGVVIGNPIPDEYAMPNEEINVYIEKALQMCKEKGIKGKDTTPFLLATVKDLTGGDSLKANLELAYNNARAAARIAKSYFED
ncbi:MAG: pseudouridine-5'-phosphate glycosidase [Solobacterium sp.]|nr:pseudouridine-5'-phosphate glycosidase [Erysipelotrichaceae bacterium]MCI6701572.1 pseudouridine-5'-phosphate glycosidase [Solobacterium sp.]MDD5982493.1 pseudouridine-5'-phosphate glycosidase [Solobacterium sp.]MDD6122603.1 pseudouridine-5'-phosphate glycosidase [Solobacterium sp.]MDD6498101.1 pseudouridine-5'-phosphate glycosidase [Solobacterium sp.]